MAAQIRAASLAGSLRSDFAARLVNVTSSTHRVYAHSERPQTRGGGFQDTGQHAGIDGRDSPVNSSRRASGRGRRRGRRPLRALAHLHRSGVQDVTRLRAHPLVNPSIPIHGLIYDVRTGRLREVEAASAAGRARG